MISLFPSLQKMDIKAMMSQMPEQFTKFFGNDLTSAYTSIEGYLSMEFLSFFFILIVLFYVGSAAGSAIAGQIEKKTMDFNLSQPIPRTKFVISQSVIALLYSMGIVLATALSMFVFGKIFNAEFKITGLLAFSAFVTLFVWAFYGIGIFLSSFLRSKMSVMLAVVMFGLASYVFLSLTRMVDSIKDLDYLSIFHLYDPQKILQTGELNLSNLIVLAGIFLIGLTGSVIIFNKKDV
jgi:ABC-type transport system involved in multi-copper enzyme maturation permease subunit